MTEQYLAAQNCKGLVKQATISFGQPMPEDGHANSPDEDS